MKKILTLMFTLVFSMIVFSQGENAFGVVYDEDFIKSGVTQENLEKAKILMKKSSVEYKKMSLDKQKLELDANQLILEGAEKNLDKLDQLFEQIGALDASILKAKVRSQVEMYKYITRDQYLNARRMAATRIMNGKKIEEESNSSSITSSSKSGN